MSTEMTASTRHTSEQTVEPSPEEAPAPETREQDEDLPLDVVFDMLSVGRRRQVLHYLLDRDEGTTLSDLAERIAAIENDKPERALSSTERKRVYVGLYQCHLPRMDDAGVIEYDSNRGTVELGPNADAVTSYLSPDDESAAGSRRPAGALALGFAGAGLVVAQSVLFPHALLAGVAIGLFVSAVCLAVPACARTAAERPSVPELLDRFFDERPV